MPDRTLFIDGTHGKIFVKVTDAETLNDGRPVIFIIPGGPGLAHPFYEKHSGHFREEAHLVYIDHFGTGQSGRADDESLYTMATHVADIECVRRALVEKCPLGNFDRVSLLGTSYGGMCALQYATLHQAHLSSLILVSTTHTNAILARAKDYLETNGSEKQKLLGRKLFEGTFQNNDEVLAFFNAFRGWYYKRYQPERALTPFCEYEPLNFAFASKFQGFELSYAQLRSIKCPTIILTAEDDWICDTTFSNEIMMNVPDCRSVYFRGCGHGIALDNPDEYTKTIRGFVREVLNPRTSHSSKVERRGFEALKFSEVDAVAFNIK